MLSNNGTISVSIHIMENDLDIAEWFNMLREAGRSRSLWCSALLLAYDRGERLSVGCVTTPADYREPEQPATFQPLLYGNGPLDKKTKKKRDGWEIKNADKEFIPGSIVVVRLSNKRVIKAYEKLLKEGWQISTIIKYTLKQSLRYGEKQELPDERIARDYVKARPPKHLLWPNTAKKDDVHPPLAKPPAEIPPEPSILPPEKPETEAKQGRPNPLLDFIG